jgi:hypothetical protein
LRRASRCGMLLCWEFSAFSLMMRLALAVIERKIAEVKCHIHLFCQRSRLPTWLITVSVNLDHLAEVCVSGYCTVKWPFHPLFPYCTLWKKVIICSLQLRDRAFHDYNEYLMLSAYKEERFILVHNFRNFSPWSLSPVVYVMWQGRTSHQGTCGRAKLLTITARKQAERERKGDRVPISPARAPSEWYYLFPRAAPSKNTTPDGEQAFNRWAFGGRFTYKP